MANEAIAQPMLIDPIAGTTASAFLLPDQVLESQQRMQSRRRALLDIRRVNNPEENVQSIYERTTKDVSDGLAEDYMQQELAMYAANEAQVMTEQLFSTLDGSRETTQMVADNMQHMQALQEVYTDFDGYWRATVDAKVPVGIDEIKAQRKAVRGYSHSLLEEIADDKGLIGDTIDYATTMLAVDSLKDITDIFEEGPFDSAEKLRAWHKNFQGLTPDEQMVLMQRAVPELLEAYDNNTVKTAAMLEVLLSPDDIGPTIAFGALFDALTVADAVLVYKAVKGVMSARSLAQRSVDSDAIEEAAQLEAAAGLDRATARDAVGVSQVDAAHSANPTFTRAVDEGTSIDNLAGEIDVVLKRQTNAVPPDYYPVNANILPPDTFKALKRELDMLEQAVKESAQVGAKARIAQIHSQLIDGSAPARAEAALARASRGDLPESIKPQVKEAIEKEKVALRKEPEPPLGEAPFTAVVPKQAVIADQIRALEDAVIRPQAFTPEEEAKALERVTERIQKELNESGLELNGKPVIARDGSGYTVKYNTTSGEGEHTFRFTKDEIGSNVSENTAKDFKVRWTAHFSKLFTPETLLQDLDPRLVADITFSDQQASLLKNELAKIWKTAESGLSKEQNFQVNALLQAGDEEAVEQYLIADLRTGGIETAAGKIKYSDAQIESYLQKRTMFRELHRIRDVMIREQLEFEGYENLAFVQDGISRNLIGRRLQTFSTEGIGKKDAVYIPGNEKGDRFLNSVTLEAKKQFYKDNDFEIVELLEPFKTNSGQDVKFALVNRGDEWSRLPQQVLNYQAGYVPRIYKKGYWYVRDMDASSKPVLYAFPSKAKAQSWVDQYKAETGGTASVFKDQEFSKLERLVEDANAYGGLYTGSRKQRPLMVKDGEKEFRPERISVAQATERYIHNISNVMPMNEYRMAAMERWKNDVKAFAEASGRSGLGPDQHFNIDPARLDLPEDTKKLMLMQRDYLKEAMSIGARDESRMEGIMLGAANVMEGKQWLAKPRQFLLDTSEGNPTAWLKGHSFNLMMGWFNIRQLFVQSQNAALTISLDPKNGLLGAADAFKMRTIALLDESRAKQAADVMGLESDIVQSLAQYNKSGLRDGIVKQADFNVHELGVAPSSLDVARHASKQGRVFFNEGENFSRLISWSTARRRWKEANPGKPITDDVIRELSQEALRMQMNMQSANAAWWQKAPVLDLMTQFLQVQAKFLEGVMPRMLGGSGKWTAREKAQVLAGQIILYGTVGVPVVEESVAYIAALTGEDPVEFVANNPDFVTAINEGFAGYTASLLGAGKLAPSESFSILAGMDDTVVYDVLKGFNHIFNGGYEEEGFIATLTGPSATTIKRAGDVYSGLALTARAIMEKPSMDVAYGALLQNVDDIASMTSTWSNAKKAYYLHTMDKLFSSTGKLVATSEDLGELSLMEQLGMAMGIPTDIEAQHYKNKDALKRTQKERRDKKQQLKEALIEWERSGNEALWKAKQAFLLSDVDSMEAGQIMEEILNESISGKSDVDKTTNQAIQSLMRSGDTPTTAQSILLNKENK